MRICFESVTLHNFLSYGDAKVQLSADGYTIVSGSNKKTDDNAKSNGSGKTAIFEAILWALTGDTLRGTKDVVNKMSAGGTYVILEFTVDRDYYKILRAKDSDEYKTNLKIWKNDKDISGKGIRDSEKILSACLPDLTVSLIGSVVILGQGLPFRFSNNTPGGRKEVLETLSKSDHMIEDLKMRVQKRKNALNEKYSEYEHLMLKEESAISTWETGCSDAELKLSQISKIPELKAKLAEIAEQIESVTASIAEAELSVSEAEHILTGYREDYLKIKSEHLDRVKKIEDTYNVKYSPLVEKQSPLLAERRLLTSEIAKLKDVKDTCPTCGQKLQGVVKVDTSEKEKRLKELCDAILEISKEMSALKEVYDFDLAKEKSRFDEEKVDVERKGLKAKNDLEAEKADLNGLKFSAGQLEQQRMSTQSSIDTLTQVSQNLEESIQVYKQNIAEAQIRSSEYSAKAEEIQKHIDIVNKFDTALKRDFRGVLLGNVIAYLDKKVKDYAFIVFGTHKAEIALNGNNIDISYCGKLYENLSGGERQKIDIIVQFAIRDMLCQFLNFRCNLLVIDECFDNLDSTGCQSILSAITKKLNDVKSIYIITHHTDINIPWDNTINVIKDERGISAIR